MKKRFEEGDIGWADRDWVYGKGDYGALEEGGDSGGRCGEEDISGQRREYRGRGMGCGRKKWLEENRRRKSKVILLWVPG